MFRNQQENAKPSTYLEILCNYSCRCSELSKAMHSRFSPWPGEFHGIHFLSQQPHTGQPLNPYRWSEANEVMQPLCIDCAGKTQAKGELSLLTHLIWISRRDRFRRSESESHAFNGKTSNQMTCESRSFFWMNENCGNVLITQTSNRCQ